MLIDFQTSWSSFSLTTSLGFISQIAIAFIARAAPCLLTTTRWRGSLSVLYDSKHNSDSGSGFGTSWRLILTGVPCQRFFFLEPRRRAARHFIKKEKSPPPDGLATPRGEGVDYNTLKNYWTLSGPAFRARSWRAEAPARHHVCPSVTTTDTTLWISGLTPWKQCHFCVSKAPKPLGSLGK